jgi:putative tryptophan/tyrosine transport system substrate-binding protein
MRRREFLVALGSASAWPVLVLAQQTGKVSRVGVLWHAGNEEQEAMYLATLKSGLSALGYVEGKNLELINRFADEHYDRFDALAQELVNAKVNVIVASIGAAAISAKRITTTIPVVFVLSPDPVGQHLVDSLSHPGGNLTGFSIMSADLTGKRLEILKDCLPKLAKVGLLLNPKEPSTDRVLAATQAAANRLNIATLPIEVRSPNELEQAYSTATQAQADAVLMFADAMLYMARHRIAELAIAYKIPTMAGVREMAVDGLLITLGPDFADLFRRTGVYVDKVLKGAKPSDLPVEQPTKFQLTINSSTAQALGIVIPPSVLARADEVLE